ncbi:MAG TPA: CBS domain-containing protein [Oceanipulchritudo sp.]|nr:CBS domain-containing protein [Oceanipulchritudo sp.]
MSTTAQNLLDSKKNRNVYFVTPDQSTYEALQLMAEKDVGAVAVMEENHLLGLLTEREYARKIVLHGKTSRHTPVFDTMNRDFPRVRPETSLDECMRLITDRHFRYVAVMEDEKFLGLISIGDIVKHIIAQQQASIEHLERYISGL